MQVKWGLVVVLEVKDPPAQCRRCKRRGFDPWVRKISWRRRWQPTPVFLSAEVHGQGSYSPQGRNESDTPEQLSMRTRVVMKIQQVKAAAAAAAKSLQLSDSV